MEQTTIFEQMKAMETSMRDFLSALDLESPEDSHVLQAWKRCTSCFDALRDLGLRRTELDGDELDRFEDELESLLRLNAVVTAAVGRQRDQLVERLERATTTGRLLSTIGPTETPGATCDMAG